MCQESCIDSRQGQETFLFFEASRPAVGPTKSSIRCLSRGSFPAVMRLGRDADRLLLSTAEVKNDRSLPPLHHVFRDNFILPLHIGLLAFIRRLVNPLKPELNPFCYLLALLGAHHFLHVSRLRVKLLTFRRLMLYIYGAPILDVSRSHTTTQHSR